MKLVNITPALSMDKAFLFFVIFTFWSVLVVGCAPKPYDTEITPQPVSQEMYNAMIQEGDASILMVVGDWKIRSSSQITSEWSWSNPVSIITHQLQLEQRPTLWEPVEQTLVKYASSDVAYSVWNEVRGYKIEDTIAHVVTKKIDLFSVDEQPITSADNIVFRCEQYYDDPSWNSCVARMQYGQYFVYIRGDMGGINLSVKQFLDFVELTDERMIVLLTSL